MSVSLEILPPGIGVSAAAGGDGGPGVARPPSREGGMKLVSALWRGGRRSGLPDPLEGRLEEITAVTSSGALAFASFVPPAPPPLRGPSAPARACGLSCLNACLGSASSAPARPSGAVAAVRP
ncbi:MAG: hypothetical protein LBT40_14880, partial [Deltaproteobacteria bacterium]|nr:hypothetical protein [Deltaproteobacteria bacterium]